MKFFSSFALILRDMEGSLFFQGWMMSTTTWASVTIERAASDLAFEIGQQVEQFLVDASTRLATDRGDSMVSPELILEVLQAEALATLIESIRPNRMGEQLGSIGINSSRGAA
ncbi:MAG: hypothetical protein SFV23_04465 [Planctomycetaceae bacterium]|nr:hypothetical protein [Planctomycetaceae bacterium]